MMYLILLIVFIILSVFNLFYVYNRLGKFYVIRKITEGSRVKKLLVKLPPVIAMAVWCVIKPIHGLIAVVHLLIFWLLAELLFIIIRKITKKEFKLYWQGVLALVVTAVYLGSGWYFAHHVYETDYAISTEKALPGGNLRVLVIADSHVGSTFDGDGFAKHMEKAQETEPDIMFVVGDYVDDDTTREDMVKCCAALGKMKTTYGVYYVFGNHDRGYFNSRDFSADDMVAELEKNGVNVLTDESVLVGNSFYVIGRKDRSFKERASMAELTGGLDKSKYMIVLDHQPHDFTAQEQSGVDLVFCGHTHGGQMWPIGITGEVSGANEKTYGLETRSNTTYIVTSGISDWAIPYKTAAIAEYVVVDIKGEDRGEE